MTQAQLNSMAKRINTSLVQYEKTFGRNSAAYKHFENQIKSVMGSDLIKTTKSGHTAIKQGKSLIGHENQLKELDRPENKVRHKLKLSEELAKKKIKEDNPELSDSDLKALEEYIKEDAKEIVEKQSAIEDFFDYDITDFYMIRNEYPRVDGILNMFEEKRKFRLSYSTIENAINELYEIINNRDKSKTEPEELTEEEIEEAIKKGVKF